MTTSDHLPIVFKLSTKPFLIQQPETYNLNEAHWNSFEHKVDNNIQLSDVNSCNTQQTEEVVENWMRSAKKAKDIAIPKSSYKYLYQLKITQQNRERQRAFNMLKEKAEIIGWTFNNYNEYKRIRHDLREKCKDSLNNNCEENINQVMQVNKDSKSFWNKIK